MHKITAELLAKDKERYETNAFAANNNPEILALAQIFQMIAFPDKAAKWIIRGEVNFFPAPIYIQQAISLMDRPALPTIMVNYVGQYRERIKPKEKT